MFRAIPNSWPRKTHHGLWNPTSPWNLAIEGLGRDGTSSSSGGRSWGKIRPTSVYLPWLQEAPWLPAAEGSPQHRGDQTHLHLRESPLAAGSSTAAAFWRQHRSEHGNPTTPPAISALQASPQLQHHDISDVNIWKCEIDQLKNPLAVKMIKMDCEFGRTLAMFPQHVYFCYR